MKWTKEQQNVIDFRNRNILVSAAAGSGKTAVLVERIIKRITEEEHPVDIDKLLVVTFTKAAAAEMRERVGRAIEMRLEENPEDENLRKQQTLIHNAQITTIDSFCLFVVRNHFEEIKLEPNFRIADTGELKLLETDVLNAVFESQFQTKNPEFLKLIDAYSDKRSNQSVKDMVAKIYHQSLSNPWPKEWISTLTEIYEVKTKEELQKTPLMQGITAYVKELLLDIPEKLQEFLEVARAADGPQKYAEALELDLQKFEGIEELQTFEELSDFCCNLEFDRMPAIRNFTGDTQKKDAVSNGRNGVKDTIKELKEGYFQLELEELLIQLEEMKPAAKELVRLSLLYMAAMEEKKAQKHIMDFSDIEHAALNILVEEETKELRPTAYELKGQFEEIMIDEYQDSNQVQEEILRAISRESQGEYNLFMVGDVKQSIYRFRLARPELFMEKFSTYDLEESKKQRIDLHKNFRSRQEVLEFTNDIFYKIMDKDLGNVTYDEEAALYCGASFQPEKSMEAEVLLYEKDQEASEGTKQLEARMIAEKIIELKKTLSVTDKTTGGLRPLKNSDIVILLRSLSGWGNEFVQVLEACGIPAYASTSTGYFSAVEVQTVLSFLKILDNPLQDIPMAAVLKSPIVSLDNEELAELSLAQDSNSFAEAVLQEMENATEGKLYHFGKLYGELRSKISDTPIHELLEMVLEKSGYGDYVTALPAGKQRKANLDMLLEKAISYEKTSFKGLFHFIRYIDQLQKYEVDFGEADLIGENEDVVRLMTIHKSKGLEFPVVFVSGISKKFNEMDSKDKMVIHPDLGLGLDEMITEPRRKRKCLVRSEIAHRIHRDNLGEELRVLYVAMTRAKEKLILTGAVDSKEKLYGDHMGNVLPGKSLKFSQRIKAKSYLDWIADGILSYPKKYGFTFVNDFHLVLAETKHHARMDLKKAETLEHIAHADNALVEEMKKSFAYEYPYKQEMNKKSKYSVSELKQASMVEKYDRMEGGAELPDFLAEEREPYVPEFAKTMSLSEEDTVKNRGALRGTAMHRVMECLDFAKMAELDFQKEKAVEDFLNEELSRMLEKNLLTEDLKELISLQKLKAFVKSPVAPRMAEAYLRGDLYREKPFVMDYQGVLVQGIIDVFWLEENKIVLLDYKTDAVSAPEELIIRYKTQLDLYADALSRIFLANGVEADYTEKLLYSFKLNKIIVCE